MKLGACLSGSVQARQSSTRWQAITAMTGIGQPAPVASFEIIPALLDLTKCAGDTGDSVDPIKDAAPDLFPFPTSESSCRPKELPLTPGHFRY